MCNNFVKMRPHYAVRQNATHCSFAAWQNLLGICRHMRSRPHEKIIFCRHSSGYKNCGTRLGNSVGFFPQTG